MTDVSKIDVDPQRKELADLMATANSNVKELAGKVEAVRDLEVRTRSALRAMDEIEKLQGNLTEHKDKLKSYVRTAEDQLNSISDLQEKTATSLASATSIALASAFSERKKAFEQPRNLWAWVFVATVIVIAVFSIVDVFNLLPVFDTSSDDANQIDQAVQRLFVVAPLVWLAFFASRRQTQALRLEEEYAHKEVLSAAFDGYKNEVLRIAGTGILQSKDLSPDHPIIKLTNNTLDQIARSPGSIYKESREPTPSGSLINRGKHLVGSGK